MKGKPGFIGFVVRNGSSKESVAGGSFNIDAESEHDRRKNIPGVLAQVDKILKQYGLRRGELHSPRNRHPITPMHISSDEDHIQVAILKSDPSKCGKLHGVFWLHTWNDSKK